MNDLLHHARKAKAQLTEDFQYKARTTTSSGRFTSRPASSVLSQNTNSGICASSSYRPNSVVSNAKKIAQPTASGTGSSMSTARNWDMVCHTCGGKGHFKKDCPNKKVMLINEDNEYETSDDVDPDSKPLDEGYSSDGAFEAYAPHNPTIVCSWKVLNLTSSSENQRCNLF
jgi:hypothetical protein